MIGYDDIFSGISVGALALEKGAVVLVNAYLFFILFLMPLFEQVLSYLPLLALSS